LQTVLLSLVTSCTNWEKQVWYPDLIYLEALSVPFSIEMF
jgi:hypothetical protein